MYISDEDDIRRGMADGLRFLMRGEGGKGKRRKKEEEEERGKEREGDCDKDV